MQEKKTNKMKDMIDGYKLAYYVKDERIEKLINKLNADIAEEDAKREYPENARYVHLIKIQTLRGVVQQLEMIKGA